ncbi:sugar porter family MFS transporter [Rhodovibrionaceae bacterium A322]
MLLRLVALAALFGFLFGFDEGVIAGALPFITTSFDVTATVEGFMAAAVPLGAVGGAMLTAFWADRLGRRKVLIICSILFGVGSITSGLSVDVIMLTLSRLILGLAIGASAMAAPLFLAELAPAKNRGAIVSAFQFMITVGILVSYLIDMALEPLGAWRWMLGLGAIPGLITLIGISRAPESPRWLALNGRSQEAKQVIASVQPDLSAAQVDEIVDEIDKSSKNAPKVPAWSEFFTDNVRPIVFFTVVAFLLQQVSGINAVIYYAPTILKHAGFHGTDVQIAATVGIGAVNVLMTIVAMFVVDRLGRRPLFIIGFVGTAISLAVIAYTMLESTPMLAPLALAGLFAYITFFAVSLGPLPWLYMSELFPLALRSRGMAMASVANWSCNFLVVFLFPVIVAGFGAAVTFGIFAAFCTIGVFFAWRFAPETKGVSLEDIEKKMASAAS